MFLNSRLNLAARVDRSRSKAATDFGRKKAFVPELCHTEQFGQLQI